MNKEKMQQIIQSDLPLAYKSDTFYVYGNIPMDKFANARNSYADSSVDYNDVIGLTDETVFGSAKRGFLFTYYGYYYNGCNGISDYSTSFNSISALYNLANFNEMLDKLYEAAIEVTEDVYLATEGEDDSGGLLGSVFDIGISLLGNYLNSKAEQANEEINQKQNEEIEEFVNLFESIRERLSEEIACMREWLQEIESKDVDFVEVREFAIRFAGCVNGDKDFVLENSENSEELREDEEYLDSIASNGELYETIANFVDEEDEERESVHFQRELKRFRSDVKKIIGTRSIEDERKSLDILEKTLLRLVETYEKANDRFNDLIDDLYDMMD